MTRLIGKFAGFRWIMCCDPGVTIATRMVIVHDISVAPNVVSAWPQYQDKETEEAGCKNLALGPLARHLCQLCLAAVWAKHSLR